MLLIYKSPSADTRSATGPVSKGDLLNSSLMHIEDVRKALYYFMILLSEAGNHHDHTKIDHIDDSVYSLAGGAHLTERHHLNDRCPDDVTLIDVLERIADICMAGMARTGKVYDDSLDPKILEKAYKNTVNLLKSQIRVIDREDPIQAFTAELSDAHMIKGNDNR